MGGQLWKKIKYKELGRIFLRMYGHSKAGCYVHIGGFGGIQKGNYFGKEANKGTDIEMRVQKHRNGEAGSI